MPTTRVSLSKLRWITLRELFTGITLDPNTRTPAMVDATTRDRFYTNLYDLQNSATYQSLAGQVTLVPLGGMKDAEMAAAAQGGLAYRYALVKGNAFAVMGMTRFMRGTTRAAN